MQPEAYLTLAKQLHAMAIAQHPTPSPEQRAALCRASLGRAYYGCFLQAVSLLKPWYQGKWPQGGSVHKLVEEVFSRPDHVVLNQLGQHFKSLRIQRRLADYNLDKTQTERPKHVAVHLELASTFLTHLKRIGQDNEDPDIRIEVNNLRTALARYHSTHS